MSSPVIDLRSLIVMPALMGAVMGLVLLALRRSYPASIRGMPAWGLAPLVGSASVVFFALEGHLPLLTVVLLGNLLLFTAYALYLFGSRRFLGLPGVWRGMATAIAAVLAALTWFTVVQPDYRVRLTLATGTLAVIAAIHTRLLLRHGRGFAARFTAMAQGAQVPLMAARALSTPWADHATSSRFDPSLVQTAYLVTFCFTSLLVSIGVLLMASERVRVEFERLAHHDALTGTLTRHALLEVAAGALDRWRRYGHPLRRAVQ